MQSKKHSLIESLISILKNKKILPDQSHDIILVDDLADIKLSKEEKDKVIAWYDKMKSTYRIKFIQ